MRWLSGSLWRGNATAARHALTGYGVALLALALATLALIPLRERLGLFNIGLLYLLLVVVVAARWGWGPSLVASVVANLAFNFFFITPLYRFTVQEPHNIVALLVFLGVASLTSGLLSRARAGEAAARRREQETAILYELSRLIITNPDGAATLAIVCHRIRDTFGAASCTVLLLAERELRPIARSGPLDAVHTTAYERTAAMEAITSGTTVALGGRAGRRRPRIVGIEDRRAPVIYVPLRIGPDVIGVLQVVGGLHAQVFTRDEGRLLEAFADEAALALDRDRLLGEAARVQALQEADSFKTVLLSVISHDLRTPLTAILTSVSSLLQPDISWDAHSRHQFLTAIEGQALRLTRLVGNLLDLSRIEGGALRPNKVWCDVREVIDAALASMQQALVRHTVLVDVAPDVGDTPLDQVQMSQVIANLVENAAKFAPPGTTIRVAAHRRAHDLVLDVCDEGPGIAPEERERVFEKFYRLSRGTPGTGLGLAICRGLVQAHGGHICAGDAPGGGARFTVTIPAPQPAPSVLAALDREAR